MVTTGVAAYYKNRTTEDLFQRERGPYTPYVATLQELARKHNGYLVPRHVVVDMNSILHTDYLEITLCVKLSLTTKVKNKGTF